MNINQCKTATVEEIYNKCTGQERSDMLLAKSIYVNSSLLKSCAYPSVIGEAGRHVFKQILWFSVLIVIIVVLIILLWNYIKSLLSKLNPANFLNPKNWF